ncbi:MAG: EscU/YscU/HrcU family type III secretion system export apparatus switch protein [Calditrichia bacterium]
MNLLMAKENKKREAVALKYRMLSDTAPKVVAKGRGSIADNILELAEKNHIPVLEDSRLVKLLMEVELEQPIPLAAFEAVAQVYAFILELDKKYAESV